MCGLWALGDGNRSMSGEGSRRRPRQIMLVREESVKRVCKERVWKGRVCKE